MKIKVSIILLHYKNHQATLYCLKSLKNIPAYCEIILMDNSGTGAFQEHLDKSLPKLRYISTPKNLGFGGGMNNGARYAKGKYLFLLNDDCYVFPNTIPNLIAFLDKHPETALVTPMLLDKDSNRYPDVGTHSLTPLSGMFALTFLNKIWPTNPISDKYWVKTESIKEPTPIDVAPGTAFVVRKDVFQQLGGFDENFFLYFEEFDLNKRIKDLGYDIYLIPEAQVIHYWAQSTPSKPSIKAIFNRSRFYYFQKHYGLLWALLIDSLARVSYSTLLIPIILLGAFLRFFQLSKTMLFFGDISWFYVSARDALLSGILPVAGITSSMTWLHQGPLWSYFLIPLLAVSRFHPVSGAILTSSLGTFTILLVYYLARLLTSKRGAVLSAFVLAVSPLVVIHSRMPYHTSLIPFFLAACLLLLIRRKYTSAFIFLGFLYQLELATIILWPIFALYLLKQKYRFNISNILGFCFGILPFIITGPRQTFGVFRALIDLIVHHVPSTPALPFYSELFIRYFFPAIPFVGLSIMIISLLLSLRHFKIYFLWLLFPMLAMLINRTPSEAYFTILVVPLALMVGNALSRLPKYVPLLMLINVCYLLTTSFLSKPNIYGPTLSSRVNISESILSQSNTSAPQVFAVGPGDQFPSYQIPYAYLIWWLSRTNLPAGIHTQFEVLEQSQTYRVLK